MKRKSARTLPDGAETLLTGLWSRLLASDARPLTRPELSAFAQPVCAIARADGLLPEELIVAVKNSWKLRHEPCLPGDRPRLDRILTDVVSALIDGFYSVDERGGLARSDLQSQDGGG
ncbi:MAG: hypothetical protein ACREND_18335 [Gemmatimonadaceae bacterium]